MASSSSSSSSSSSPRNWGYNVFTSFHGPDVRIKLLSHLRQQFDYNGITMFDDNGIERSQIIAPALTKAIGESRIAIVLLSENYASSSWCLDELLEILKCKEDIGQIVMTVFYEVDPSHVRKQTGDFGIAFDKTCAKKTENRRKWSEALNYVGNIAGEDFKHWTNEAKMIEKIARDVSTKINATPCRDFDDMVGLDAHLKEMESLLDLDYDGAKIVGISGPAGIGKSTIARALRSRHSSKFQHYCFVDNLWENYKICTGEHGVKLRLHEQFFSKILKQNGMELSHLSVIRDRLHDKKVLIILDDVESLAQLETLANITWFGPGSRVIVTTEDKMILQQHGISDIYQVGFPSESEALTIFCLSAFKQPSPPDGFMDLADNVVRICGKLPLALRVLGSSLLRKSQTDWEDELPRLRNRLDKNIESVLKVGFESLDEKDRFLFLYIAIFFNYEHADHVTLMLAKSNLDVRLGLKNLDNRYLIHIDHDQERRVVVHRLLRVMAIQVSTKQEPWKSQILVDAEKITYVLEDATGSRSIKGVSFDIAEIDELMISPKAFERMCNLLFLKVYDRDWHTGKRKLDIPENIKFPRSIRLFHWDAYSGKRLPSSFFAENLVEVNMQDSELQTLWEGTQRLANLKKINLSRSSHFKVLPDLSNATNPEELTMGSCTDLVELPSSIGNLQKLAQLVMYSCESLEVIPSFINLASLKWINMNGCSRLRRFPDIPTNIEDVQVTGTTLEDLPASLTHCSGLQVIKISGSVNLKIFYTELPTSVNHINISNSGIEWITDCIKGLHNLHDLCLSGCKRLVSLPELPSSLKILQADDCDSLESLNGHLNTPNAELYFANCFKLDGEARRAIIQQSFVHGWALLPGTEVPAEFDHRAIGNSLIIPYSASNKLKVCVVMSLNQHQPFELMPRNLLYRWTVIGNSVSSDQKTFHLTHLFNGDSVNSKLQKPHLFIFHSCLPFLFHIRNIVLEISSEYQDFDILECGVQILTDESSIWGSLVFCEAFESEEEDDDSITDRRPEVGETSHKEGDKEGDKSEPGESSKDKDEDMAEGASQNEDDHKEDDGGYESVSRKRPRRTMITNLKWGIQKRMRI